MSAITLSGSLRGNRNELPRVEIEQQNRKKIEARAARHGAFLLAIAMGGTRDLESRQRTLQKET